jgi:hypothetical protein
MKHLKVLLVVLSCVLFTLTLAGCAALLLGGAAGAGGAVYIKGELKEDMSASVPRVHHATIAALKELNLPVNEDIHDKLSAKIQSRFADGAEVWIAIESVTAESSKVTIRVGVMGDEQKARQILGAIHRHLG